MSRIGRMPIPLPEGVTVDIKGNRVKVRGPKGELSQTFDPSMRIKLEDNVLQVFRPGDDRRHRALHGLTRALLANMVTGVFEGFQKQLQIEGVGYRADVKADGTLEMGLGYSHLVLVEPPEGISFEVEPRSRVITVSGINKQVVGQIAAVIRAKRPPEPYRGKGIRYVDEQIRRKAGKTGV
ncbi:MAG: 50S ribosomal protein L6 [Anaerolineae bacterium]|nr:50S ribosomal protein L6 [Anaerolineae bacterium]